MIELTVRVLTWWWPQRHADVADSASGVEAAAGGYGF